MSEDDVSRSMPGGSAGLDKTPSDARATIGRVLADRALSLVDEVEQAAGSKHLPALRGMVLRSYLGHSRHARATCDNLIETYSTQPVQANAIAELWLAASYYGAIEAKALDFKKRLDRMMRQLTGFDEEVGLDLLAQLVERIRGCWDGRWLFEEKVSLIQKIVDLLPDAVAALYPPDQDDDDDDLTWLGDGEVPA